ncbi:MAG TPA: aminoglycoside 6'-acetyltransferase [Sphingobium sp.]|jgi:aminoglycoside 6'-N-acetyltransferase I|uniref:aminoglycoside 6'-N-acetyltransferase n=1 Tax=Sphingobium sp. TaxID=1912891 RepID=UPI000ECF847E|nr:aminoglycoside 6'-N-acetyltransferase [Sphingobium sp.]HAF40711.1 aminoglycoside 6'-acetyltransferase [Sphingobium sp.]
MSDATVRIVPAGPSHVERWALMRAELWPDASLSEHRDDILAQLKGKDAQAAFLALDQQGDVIGFAEAALRHDYVNGCDSSPVLFLEGIFVEPSMRRGGIGRALADAAKAWGQTHGCTEMASDADIAHESSHAFHAALGFAETERVVFFRKAIG